MQRTSIEAGTDTSHLPRESHIAQDQIPPLVTQHIDGFLEAHNTTATEGTRLTIPATHEFPWTRMYVRYPNGSDELHYASPDSVNIYSAYRGNAHEGTSFKHTIYDLSIKALSKNDTKLAERFAILAKAQGIEITPVSEPVPMTEGVLHAI